MKISTLYFRVLAVLLGISWLGLHPQQAQAQNYSLPVSGTANYTTCSGTLYDDGGASGQYALNANGAVTLTPATAGNKIKLDFTALSLEPNYDYLYVYDGASTSAPLLGRYTGTTLPGTLYASTASGTLTVQLISDEVYQAAGFAATISCVATLPQADLTVQNANLSPTALLAGSSTAASATVTNLSGTQASSSNLGYYLSTDNTLSANDVLLTSSGGGALASGTSATRSATLTIPASTASGTYYILFAADYQNQVAESNENNNVASVAITVAASGVDLTVIQQSLYNSSAPAGATVSASAYVYNQGNQSASSSNLGFYLSTNTTFDSNDVLLTTAAGYTLAASTSSSRAATLTIPTGTTPGSYYVLFVADPTNLVAESVETNNVAYAALSVTTPAVDLTIYSPYLNPTQVLAGTTISPSSTLYNLGNAAANPATVGYYLSTNSTLDANDVLIGNSSLGSLAGNDYRYAYGTPTIPTGTAPGSYYLLYVADYLNQLAESNENNNVSALSISVVTPNADLYVSGATASPSQTVAGGTINTSGYLYNQGNALATPARVGYYLSTNSTLDASDVLVGNYSLGSVYGGSYGYFYGSATIPTGTAAGSYYLLFVADYLNQVAESNENNNVSAYAIQVVTPSVDLVTSSVYASPSQVVAGNSFNTSGYLYNQGNAVASPATVGYYLSANTTLDANDVLIGNSSLGSVSAGSYSSIYGSATIPAGTTNGSYYVLFVADYLNQLAESNENNNVSSTSITVVTPAPDLYFPYSSSLATSQAFAGSTISSTCYPYNQGNVVANPATVGYYLSTNSTLDASDVLIGSASAGSISANSYASLYSNLTIPANTASGFYYVLFVADYLNQLAESNENNNVAAATLQVSVSTTDLSILSPTATPTTVANGGTVSTSCLIFNSGTTAAGSSTVGYYLSNNTTFDANDVLLNTSSGGTLSYGSTSYRSLNLTIPVATVAGNYYLLFVADPAAAVVETNETNNVSALALTVTGNFIGYVVPATGSNTITACSGNVYDSGISGDYANNANGTLTIQPGTNGMSTRLVFNAFATEQGHDFLQIYDGPNTSYPLLGTYNGVAGPGTVQASRNNFSGALTLRFTSDGSNTAAGFQAAISCVQPLATREQTAGYDLSVFPNPVSAAPLRVQLSGVGTRTDATLTLRNSLGQLVATRSLALLPGRLNQLELETTGLATGVYLLQLTGTDLNATRRVVID